ncbi:DDE superfamily endonuclease-domain-containing protein [Mycena latifolia]|nr:DDE superfamily endonuclease-domain-containing protein [Mycena latifolia]
MSKDLAIIVVLGSRKAGRKLVAAASHITDRRLALVEGYSSSLLPAGFLGPANLSGIEGNVKYQIEQLGGTTNDVAGIAFMYSSQLGNCSHFPFTSTTSLLGFSGPNLFEKLFVVSPSPSQDLEGRWSDLVDEGMHILRLESQPEALLRQILDDSSSLSSKSPAHSTVMLSANVHEAYTRAAAVIKRDRCQAVILLVGQSGHGKSKTINRLIGQDLLRIGQSTLGSTTKAIQRVKVVSTSKTTSTTVTVAFDDTPGLEDTTYLDRKTNAALMHRYKEKYFQDIFPNVILLVASWDSIMADAHNKASHFTSAIGRSMYNLFLSGLVDGDRTNVLVVITKSLSSWDQFDDFKTQKEKNAQWRLEAGRRKGIITDLQRKIFPKSSPWAIVFIENGGGRDMSATYPILPDGKQSHQNLFEAISAIMERNGPGAEPLSPSSTAEVENLVEQSPEEIADQETIETEPLEERIRQLTGSYLGYTYDINHGTYGRKSVLSMVDLPIQYTAPPNQNDEFEQKTKTHRQQASELSMRREERLRDHYSSSWALRSAVSTDSQQYSLHHIIQLATVDPDRVELSAEMRNIISGLPPFSPLSEKQYMQFFADYGTHVVTRLALGGVLRVVLNSRDEASKQKTSATGNGGVVNSTSGRFAHSRRILVFRDGGGSVAPELTRFLEHNFVPDINSPDWQQVRNEWMKDLEKDPVFCPDHPLTEYQPLYTVRGLTGNKQKYLEDAYQIYVQKTAHREKGSEIDKSAEESKSLPRRKNWFMVARLLRESVTQAVSKFGGNRLKYSAKTWIREKKVDPLFYGRERSEKCQCCEITVTSNAPPTNHTRTDASLMHPRGRPRGTRRQQEKWAEKQLETNYEHAKEDLHAPGGMYATAAELHDVPLSSLWHREHGRKNRRDWHEGQKKASTMEEEIVKLLKELESWGLNFDREFIMARAQDILDERGSNDTITLSWYKKFRARYPDLKTQLSERKDISRSDAEKDPARFDKAFKNFERLFTEYIITPERLFNVDEKGFMLGITNRHNVVIFRRGWDDDAHASRATVPQDGNRELITVVDCISAGGDDLPPLISYKGKQLSFSWSRDSQLPAAYYSCSQNDWTTHMHNLAWLKEVFDPRTRHLCPNGEWMGLVFDNLKSHVDYPTVKFYLQHKIVCCTLPSKTSGVLQPLDVSCFRPLQQSYGKAVEEQTAGRVRMTKTGFIRILPSARKEAFTRARIVDGFERAGIYPFNPGRFEFLVRWREQQAKQVATRTASPEIPALVGNPSFPARKQKTNRILAENTRLRYSPPATPSSLLRALEASNAQIVQYHSRIALQGVW